MITKPTKSEPTETLATGSTSRSKTARIASRWLAVLLSSVWLLVACGEPETVDRPTPSRPHVVIVSVDTLRADHTSLYGYERATTPNLRALGTRSGVFEVAYSPSSTTGPSHATLLTGLHPVEHDVRKNAMVLDKRFRRLPQILSEVGYRTAAIVSSYVFADKFGWSIGFDHYDAEFDQREAKTARREFHGHAVPAGFDRRARFTTDRAIRWLEQNTKDERPAFLFLHYFDPHDPYKPPARFGRQWLRSAHNLSLDQLVASYDGEIEYWDAHFGRLLQFLEVSGLLDQTLLVVTADHGEGLMQYGDMTHGVQIYQGLVRVPLLFCWRDRIAARRLEAPAATWSDIGPTILDLIDVADESGALQRGVAPGRRLADLLLGSATSEPSDGHPVHLYRQHYDAGRVRGIPVAGEQFAVVRGGWKLILAPDEGRAELFNLVEDPSERRNLAGTHPQKVETLASEIRPFLLSAQAASESSRELSDEDREALRTLGYLEDDG